MENLVFIKTSLWLVLVIAALGVIALIIYELRKASGGLADTVNGVLDSVLGPRTVTTPANLQHFMNEPANNGYQPWVAPTEDDESYPPSWLSKG